MTNVIFMPSPPKRKHGPLPSMIWNVLSLTNSCQWWTATEVQVNHTVHTYMWVKWNRQQTSAICPTQISNNKLSMKATYVPCTCSC